VSRRAAGVVLLLVVLTGAAACGKPGAAGATGSSAAIELPPFIPANASAIVAFDGAGDWFEKLAGTSGMAAADAKAMHDDIATYVRKTTGLDLSRVHRGTLFVAGTSGALIVREVGGDVRLAVPEGLVAVRHQDFLIVGPKAGVEAAAAVGKGEAPGLAKDSPLAQLFAHESAGAGFAIAADLTALPVPELEDKVAGFGATHAFLALGARGVHLVARGDGKKMAASVQMVQTMLAAQAKQAAEQKQRILAEASAAAGPSVEDFSVVVGAHTLAQLVRMFHPVVEGDQLRFDLTLDSPNLVVVVGAVGVMAAVAIPAFMKYTRKSKTTEASARLDEISDAAIAYYGAHHALPPSVASTPEPGACCHRPEGRCSGAAMDWSAWKTLGFHIDEPFDYSYAFDVDATGFTARAVGDLDCDGTFSTFEMAGTLQPDGTLKGAGGIFKKQELE
jgi:type II secretory pathway pseudopilin PulG